MVLTAGGGWGGKEMWIQRIAPLVGRSPSVDKLALRQNKHPQKRQKSAKTETCECKDQQTLPGLETVD